MKTDTKKKYRIISYLLLIITVPLFSQENNIKPSFADNLFEKGEYYRAITEYNRFLFNNAQTADDSLYAFLQISKSYYLGKDYENAISSITEITSILNENNKIIFNRYLALSYLKLGFPKSAIFILENNTDEPKSKLLLGITHLFLNEWDSAIDIFESLDNNSADEITLLSSELVSISKNGKAIRKKKPVISAILSAIIPGSGYVYTENYQTGISSFLINLLLLGSSYELHKNGFKFTGSTASLVSFGWYLGNVYGSFTSAIKHNKMEQEDFLNDSCKKYIDFIEN